MLTHPFLKKVISKAKRARATIVLAEAEDERIIQAAAQIEKEKIATIILLGSEKKIESIAKKCRVALKSVVIDTKKYKTSYEDLLYESRKHKGLTRIQARKLVQDPHYFAALMVKAGDADGYVSGNSSTTADTLRPALQLLRTKEHAFSYFIMLGERNPLFFADCALNIQPDEKMLASIGVGTAKEAKLYGIRPRVAFLSYSSHKSAAGAEFVRGAAKRAQKKLPKIPVDGELQFDAAFIERVAKKKVPQSPLKGKANVFIFPDLNSGNIAYKIAQYLGRMHAFGPILTGLQKPVNDLSRGCSVDDVIGVVAMTAARKS